MPGKPGVMASNLPLLLAKGKPRDLATIELDELEEFVHFMILCSLQIKVDNKPADLNQLPLPRWWPEEDVPFRFPLCGNSNLKEKETILKRLVCRCYTYFDCEFYLKFCSELAERPANGLKYRKDLRERTTTILDAVNGSVLVKCRNENFNYDNRKTTRQTKAMKNPNEPPQPPPVKNNPKGIAPIIDLTCESSGDETEVFFKKQPSTLTNGRKCKSSADSQTDGSSMQTRRKKIEESLRTRSSYLALKSPKKKLLYENYRKPIENQNAQNEGPSLDLTSRKRKRGVHQPIVKKKRIFEDFSKEEPEPNSVNKDTFMSKLSLVPHNKEPPKISHKVEGKRKLAQSFTLMSLTCKRGQALLIRNDRFNMEALLDRNSRHCGTHSEEEEPSQVCTRSSNVSQKVKATDLFQKKTPIIKGYIHAYKWPRRTKNIVYPKKGPFFKKCIVELPLLSDNFINLWKGKKITKSTVTPEEWREKQLTICSCQMIPNVALDDTTSDGNTKSTSTSCECVQSQPSDTESNDSLVSGKLFSEDRRFTTTLSVAQQGHSNTTYVERTNHRRPLAVVPSEPKAINEGVSDTPSVAFVPDESVRKLSTKQFQLFKSFLEAMKWYSKGEPSECHRENQLKEGMVCSNENDNYMFRSQENIVPYSDLTLPGSKKPIIFFKNAVDASERDYCFEKLPLESAKLDCLNYVFHVANRLPCLLCCDGQANCCVYEFVRQAGLAGITVDTSLNCFKVLYHKYVQVLKKSSTN